MALRIREAVLPDYSEVVLLMNQVHLVHHEARPDFYRLTNQSIAEDEFRKMLDNEAAVIFVAEDQGGVIGMCIISIRNPSKNPLLVSRKLAYIETLCVHEAHRNQGVGRSLFNEAVKRVKQLGINHLELMVWSFNHAAIEFYREMEMQTKAITMEIDLE